MDKKYKIFLCNWFVAGSPGPTLSKVALGLKEKGCDILYWIGSKPPDRKKFPETIFHHNREAAFARPAEGVDVSTLEPPGEDVLEKLFECESTTLSLMDRMDYSNAPFHVRKRLYYNLVQYWHGLLKTMEPDALIFYLTPHDAHNFVLYSLAKFFRIKTILYLPINRALGGGRVLILPDTKSECGTLTKELEKVRNTKIEDLSADIRDYYVARSHLGENFKFPYSTERILHKAASRRFCLHKIPSFLIGLPRSLIEGSFFKKVNCRFYNTFRRRNRLFILGKNYTGLIYSKKLWEWRRALRSSRKEYESLQSAVDWDKKFIFVALHYQPERSTCPEGGVFNDQLLMLNILSYAIPKDWALYVKEHPIQFIGLKNNQAHLARYKGYYKGMTSLGNVFLVPASITPDKLIEKCQAVATVTGTAGIEAVFKGKPALIFGYPPYKECSEICRVWDVQSCRGAIEKIRNGYRPDQQKVLDYLGALDRVGIRMRLDWRREDKAFAEVSDERMERGIRDIADALYCEIQK